MTGDDAADVAAELGPGPAPLHVLSTATTIANEPSWKRSVTSTP